MKTSFFIDSKKYSLNVKGKLFFGKDEILINKERNLLDLCKWNEKGFIKKSLLSKKKQDQLQRSIIDYIEKKVIINFNKKVGKKFKIENYNNVLSYFDHLTLIGKIEKGIKFTDIEFDKKILEEKVSDLINKDVTTKNPSYKEINPTTFALRIVRPKKNDFNPPHKDIYLDRLKNGINIYIPIYGSNKMSSLPVMPKSHFYSEKDIMRTENGAIINDIKFRVPCIIKLKNKNIKMIRPNPKMDEILIFSPYCIHGGGSNDNLNNIRISLELRFWEK